jgi:hypothetical protein
VLRSVMALSVADQARELLATLSLNKSQVAELLRVSRPTVYRIDPSFVTTQTEYIGVITSKLQ